MALKARVPRLFGREAAEDEPAGGAPQPITPLESLLARRRAPALSHEAFESRLLELERVFHETVPIGSPELAAESAVAEPSITVTAAPPPTVDAAKSSRGVAAEPPPPPPSPEPSVPPPKPAAAPLLPPNPTLAQSFRALLAHETAEVKKKAAEAASGQQASRVTHVEIEQPGGGPKIRVEVQRPESGETKVAITIV